MAHRAANAITPVFDYDVFRKNRGTPRRAPIVTRLNPRSEDYLGIALELARSIGLSANLAETSGKRGSGSGELNAIEGVERIKRNVDGEVLIRLDIPHQ